MTFLIFQEECAEGGGVLGGRARVRGKVPEDGGQEEVRQCYRRPVS
jgi:hypothetical protein